MALKLPDNDSAPFFIIGTDAKGAKGATLPTGASINVTSADPNTVVITLDPTPLPAPDGTASLASGKVSSATPPAQLKTPINVTAQVVLADGTNGDSGVDTVEVDPGVETAVGVLFGDAVPVSASAKKR